MSHFREKMARFMYGRYGTDELYFTLCVVALILLFAGAVCSVLGHVAFALTVVGLVLYVCALLLMVFAIYRTFSRNLSARQKENQAYLRLRAKLRRTPHKSARPVPPPDTDTHVFRSCPHCSAVLRLPRQAGKHTVRCPRCQKPFTVRVRQCKAAK
jgi:small-conductance mechanosensitive channel